MKVVGESPVIEAADRLHDVLYPPDGRMLPRQARIDALQSGISGLALSLIDRAEAEPMITDELIFAAGAYCASDAYLSVASQESVGQEVADVTARNFNEASEFFNHNRNQWQRNPQSLGAMAEFVVLSTIWNGIRDGAFNGYAFMAHSPDWAAPSDGLRGDIDIVGRIDGKRQNLQVKLARAKESHLYKGGITVVSPESIAHEGRRGSVSRLLSLGQQAASQRFDAYDRLRAYLKK